MSSGHGPLSTFPENVKSHSQKVQKLSYFAINNHQFLILSSCSNFCHKICFYFESMCSFRFAYCVKKQPHGQMLRLRRTDSPNQITLKSSGLASSAGSSVCNAQISSIRDIHYQVNLNCLDIQHRESKTQQK